MSKISKVSCYADNEALGSDSVGRVVVDGGYTKNYCSWDEAGTARYILLCRYLKAPNLTFRKYSKLDNMASGS